MSLRVEPVRSKADLKTFIKLPFSLYAGCEHWVPPIIADRKRFLDRSKNPFFEHGEAAEGIAAFVAKRPPTFA